MQKLRLSITKNNLINKSEGLKQKHKLRPLHRQNKTTLQIRAPTKIK